jgi:hypothetical protein
MRDRLRNHEAQSRSGNTRKDQWIRGCHALGESVKLIPLPFKSERAAVDFYGIENLFNAVMPSENSSTALFAPTDEMVGQFGKVRDLDIAEVAGVSRTTVRRRREAMGIAPYSRGRPKVNKASLSEKRAPDRQPKAGRADRPDQT